MTLTEKLTGVYLFWKEWAEREPAKYRALRMAVVALATRYGLELDPDLALLIDALHGAVSTRGVRKRVTPERSAQARIQKAVAAERDKHTTTVSSSVMGSTALHTTAKKTPVKRKPKGEAGQAWMPFLLGVVVCVIVLALLGRIAL